MKIVYIYRQSRPGGYSIEILFQTIAGEMRKHCETLIEYELGPRYRILFDVLALRRLNADIYHITGDVNYLAFFLPGAKTVLTIHDIGHYLFGLLGWRQSLYRWLWLLGPMRLAGRVTAVSTATRDHIVEHLGYPPERITVIDNCHHPIFHPVPKPFNAACPRILQVGTQPYKNVPRLIRALQGTPCRLVLIGKLDADIMAARDDTGVEIENHVGISQQALFDQYVAADLVTFISIGEGFGLPIIEAQAMARPLVTANIPPMSVAAGEGACLVDPLDLDSMRGGIVRLINDDAFRNEVIRKGLENVTAYSPETVARQYLKLNQTLYVRN